MNNSTFTFFVKSIKLGVSRGGEGMAVQLDMTDSKGSRIIKEDDNVKIYKKNNLLYDGPYKDVHVIGIVAGMFSSGGKISFGFPGKIFRMDFYPKSKQHSLQLKEMFADKVQKHEKFEKEYNQKIEDEKLKRKAEKEEKALIREQKSLIRLQKMQYYRLAKCPRCRSTSISYDTKKLSIGRALVGDAIAGAPGAVLGGLSSKKGYAVCLNCGKRWKL